MITNAVILAAGHGTRMRSRLPKVLHPLLGRPMVHYTIETAQTVTGRKPTLVIGHQAEAVASVVESSAHLVVQKPQLGTAHAVQQSAKNLQGHTDQVLVLTADMPLLTAETLHRLVQTQAANRGPLTMMSIIADDPRGFGRVIRNDQGNVIEIREEALATPEQLEIRELNASVYCFAADWLWQALHRVQISPKGEYYLTDLIEIAVADGYNVNAIVIEDPKEAIGINTRIHLAEAQQILRRRINQQWMLAGVTIFDPETTTIEPAVQIGKDSTILPNSYLRGETIIGEDCEIGPNVYIWQSQIGNACTIFASVIEHAVLEDGVDIGPFGHVRKDGHLGKGVHMGNFGEVKNSYLGPGTKMGHFSYIGDATIGPNVNIGAGTITCNYDGERKYPTEIGAGAFIGSDTMLVAPVEIGEGARTGAGAVVTKDVPADTLAVGMPARAIRKLKKK